MLVRKQKERKFATAFKIYDSKRFYKFIDLLRMTARIELCK